MSYVKNQFQDACYQRFNGKPIEYKLAYTETYMAGLQHGFEIALLTYGVWRDGRQVIGAQDTPVRDIINVEFGRKREEP